MILTGESLTVVSSHAGGDDNSDGTPHTGEFDSTGRVNLAGYQNGSGMTAGQPDQSLVSEVIRHDLMRIRAKALDAWRVPLNGYNADESAVDGPMKTVCIVHAHHGANEVGTFHSHWEVETPLANGSFTNRLSVSFGDGTGAIGQDVATVQVISADFLVRTKTGTVTVHNSNGQVDAISSAAANVVRATTTASSASGNTQAIYQATGADAGNRALGAKITSDVQNRVALYADGRMEWGDGAHSRDVSIARTGPGVLQVGGQLQIGTTRPTITGSRASGAALASLLTALAGMGLIVDGSTA